MRYRCPNCGHIFLGKRDRCPSCYQRFVYPALEIDSPAPVEEKKQEVVNTPEAIKSEPEVKKEPLVEEVIDSKEVNTKFEKKGKSKFTGTTIGLIGWKIAGFFVTVITLGICYPVALGWIYRWEVNNTIVDGHRMRFNGYASSLIPRWIGWIILSILTIGIFALTLPVRFQKWKTARMVIDD